jgi:hypothetical protein
VTPWEELVYALTLERFTPHVRADNSPIEHLPLPPVDNAVDDPLSEAS